MENRKPDLIAATRLAFDRMKTILFRPFDLGKWFALGFTAWLATLLEGGGSFNSSTSSSDSTSEESFSEMVETARGWIEENFEMILTIGSIVFVILLVFGLVITWVRSRGKFMFLDNTVQNRALIAHPWGEFKKEGNSLFFWMLIYGFVFFLLFSCLAAGAIMISWPMLEAENFDMETLPTLISLGVGTLLLGLVASYIFMLLENFVIPMMYRDRLRAGEAWSRVLAVHSQNFWQFVLFYLWMLVLGLGTGILVLVLVLATCCIAGIILAIPYLGAVLLLPLTVFYRMLGPEFLRQFGDEFDVFSVATPPSPILPEGDSMG